MHVFLVRLQCDWIEEDQYIQKRQKVRAELEIKLLHHTLIIFFQPANYSLTFKACLFFLHHLHLLEERVSIFQHPHPVTTTMKR